MLKKMLQSRLPLLLLLGLALGGLVLLGGALKLPAMMDRMETALLDLRLRVRSETLTPSDDIVIVAMDRRTLDYGRNHPEFGITGKVMPRDKLAGIIDSIAGAGARNILVDLYFDQPQNPVSDAALANAIRRAGNVYVGGYVELPLPDFKTQRRGDAQAVVDDTFKAFNKTLLLPWLDRKATQDRLAAGSCNLDAQGFGPVFDIAAALGLPRTIIDAYWQSHCQDGPDRFLATSEPEQSGMPAMSSTFVGRQELDAKAYSPVRALTDDDALASADAAVADSLSGHASGLLDGLYRQECLVGKYEEQAQLNPGFLVQLDRLKLHLSGMNAIREDGAAFRDGLSHCMISPILSPILAASRGLGIMSVQYEQDSVIRAVPILSRSYRGNWYPYLGLAPLLADQAVSVSPDRQLHFAHHTVPLGVNGRLMLNWRHPLALAERLYAENGLHLSNAQRESISPDQANPELGYGHLYRLVSAVDVLRRMQSPDLPLQETPSLSRVFGHPETGMLDFKGKTVIYGDVLEDIHRTPMGDQVYGPEVLATMLDTLSHDTRFVQSAPVWSVALLGLLFCGLIAYSQVKPPRLWIGFVIGLCLLVLYWVLNFLFFVKLAWLLPLVWPSAVFALALMGGVVYRYYVHDREKRQLTHVFSKYVSPQVMDRILADPETSLENLSGVEKELTVLFADLQGFTERFNSEDPRVMVKQLNEFFTAMTRIILKHQGTYDKYIGDAVMAFFGAPAEVPDHAAKACAAALEMQAELAVMNVRWRSEGIRELTLGIGLSTGEMIVGNFGSDVLQNFTVMGNAVNLGARLEALTRKVKSPIVISERTMQHAGTRVHARDLGMHEVKGFNEAVRVFALESASE